MSDKLIKWLTALVRLIVGGVFIFSGFVKAVDPWGTYYKFQEYFAAMGLPDFHGLVIVAAFGLCAAEFLLGVFILLGSYRKSAPIMVLVFMCFMLPLTLWIAVKNPVSDCGCFGEALHLSNWATFWKNVVLTLLAVWLLYYNHRCITIISPAFQWISALLSLFFITAIMICGYKLQPLIDFRPYPNGSELLPDTDSDDAEQFLFVYQKDGVQQEFGEDDELPDEADGWQFVERKQISSPSISQIPDDERTFRIWNRAGDEDVTDEVLVSDEKQILLLMPDMEEVSPATTWKINALYNWIVNMGGSMLAVVSGTSSQIKQWEDLSLPDYEIYTADDTAIKEVARGNPAIVYLENGIIKWKSTLVGLELVETEKGIDFIPDEAVTEGDNVLLALVLVYLLSMLFPLTLTLLPRIKDFFARKRKSGKTTSTTTPAE